MPPVKTAPKNGSGMAHSAQKACILYQRLQDMTISVFQGKQSVMNFPFFYIDRNHWRLIFCYYENKRDGIMKRYDLSVSRLMAHQGIAPRKPGREFLTELLGRFQEIPYENISKILTKDARGRASQAFRLPDTVVTDHISLGLGGTCFSLTYLFQQILSSFGFRSRLALADRTYGENTHCCILCETEGRLILADPGYLIFMPVPLPAAGEREIFSWGPYMFSAERAGADYEIWSLFPQGHRKFRYRIKAASVSEADFFDAWENSFRFDMMEHRVVNCYRGDTHIYIRDGHIHLTDKERKIRKTSPEEALAVIADLGISEKAARQVQSLLAGNWRLP